MLEAENEAYFFQQKNSHTLVRRFKKNLDELPQELRYAHLNPRVAAYLATKEKEQKLSELDLCDGLGDRSLLPQIHHSVSLIRQRLDHLLPHTEDAQRLLFDETRQTSDRLLEHLANLLCLFEGIQVDIPPGLEADLLSTYKELIADVQYVARDWQCIANKDAYIQQIVASDRSVSSGSTTNRRDDTVSVTVSVATTADEDKGKVGDGLRKGKLRGAKSSTLSNIIEVEERKFKHRKKDAVVRLSVNKERHKLKCERGKSLISTSGKSTTGSESVYSDIRSQRRLSMPRQPDVATSQGSFNKRDKDSGYWMTINFQLSSKCCDDKGWIVHPTANTNLERDTLLKWAAEQLQSVIKQKRLEDYHNKQCGNDGPLILQYYGDYHRDEMTLHKSPGTDAHERFALRKMAGFPLRGPVVPMMHQSDTDRVLLMVAVPDGSATIFYPTGYPAVVQSRCAGAGGGCYAFVYANSPERQLLAVFTPAGCAATYHDNGTIHLLVSGGGGTVALPSGEVTRRWSWPPNNGRLASSLSIALNSYVSLRCTSQSQMYLTFAHQQETRKVHVGLHSATSMLPTTTTREAEGLLSAMPFMSKAARELLKTGKGEKSRQKAASSRSMKKVQLRMPGCPEVEKILDFDLMPCDNDAEADTCLHRLQIKARELLEGWLEHYRFTLRLSSAFQGALRALGQRVGRVRLVQSASTGNLHRPATSVVARRVPSAPSASSVGMRHTAVSHVNKKHSPLRVTLNTVPPMLILSNQTDMPSSNKDDTRRKIGSKFERVAPLSELTSEPSRQPGVSPTPDTRPMQGVCPVALRQQMTGGVPTSCHCHLPGVPSLMDVEFDVYVQKCVPVGQVLVVAIVSSAYSDESATVDMLAELYVEKNAGRAQPCQQSRSDPYRIVHYDLAKAAQGSLRVQPLLLRRHNVATGMVLIYQAGKLFFCDHIFNGYGNDRRDFEKQILQLQENLENGQPPLPKDFHFSPLRGRQGLHPAWRRGDVSEVAGGAGGAGGAVPGRQPRTCGGHPARSAPRSYTGDGHHSPGRRTQFDVRNSDEDNSNVSTFSLQDKAWMPVRMTPNIYPKSSVTFPSVRSRSDIVLTQPMNA